MAPEPPRVSQLIVLHKHHLNALLNEAAKRHYTYILRQPDGFESFGGVGTPFYVGIGQGMRLFSHVEEAKATVRVTNKLLKIRKILDAGGEVIHCIEGFYEKEPWDREEKLITAIGQEKHGTGPLTNEQDYSASHKVAGVEVRKYRDVQGDDPDQVPVKFKLARVNLMAGPREPTRRTSVFGKIFTVLKEHPGVTGLQLVELLKRIDFSGNKSAYTQSGEVCAAWLCDYIEGGFFRSDRLHIQKFVSVPENDD